MKAQLASWLVLVGLLAACGSKDNGNNGGGGGGNPTPVQKMFTVTYNPTPRDAKNPQPTDFYISKAGGSVDLTVTVNITSSNTKKVRFIFSSPSSVICSEPNFVVEGSTSKTVKITAPPDLNQPYFTIQATGQDKNGDTRNQDSYAATFTWKPQ